VKACLKLPEPASLTAYRQAQPSASWDNMRNDSLHGGQQAYLDVKRSLIRGQRGLCAYCEIRLADGLDDQAIDAKRHEQRVEHFHPRSDNSDPLNWALHWLNLWAVCLGGSDRPPAGVPADPLRFQEPLPANLSCDAFKEGQIERGRLPASPEGLDSFAGRGSGLSHPVSVCTQRNVGATFSELRRYRHTEQPSRGYGDPRVQNHRASGSTMSAQKTSQLTP
jgi:uncharacterized protein (TIGR02646 family)